MIYQTSLLASFKMSLRELIDDFNNNIKPQLTEILASLKKQESSTKDNMEAAAAKIITELKSTIQDCQCNKEILKASGKQPEVLEKEKQIISTLDKGKSRYQYSYPNHDVGNEELGTGKNPKSMTWPFGSIVHKKI